MQLNILKHQLKELGQKHLVNLLKYKKYFRKTSLKQEGIGELFLNEIASKKPKNFLEIGVFHGVTARNVCELLHSIHGDEFKYIGLDLFGESDFDLVLKNSNKRKQLIKKTSVKSQQIKIKSSDHYHSENSEEVITSVKKWLSNQ